MIDLDVLIEIGWIVKDPRFSPRWGWHNDHAATDRTPAYLPAIQQDREEFWKLVDAIDAAGIRGGRCLQLGVGPCAASHLVWQKIFSHVVSVDFMLPPWHEVLIGAEGNTHDLHVIEAVGDAYDFLFIDAGHRYEDVEKDHALYAPMVRFGGIVAFHDAACRPGYEDEIGVWRYLETLPIKLEMIVGEYQIGTAYYVKDQK